jgi:hypothetical protein
MDPINCTTHVLIVAIQMFGNSFFSTTLVVMVAVMAAAAATPESATSNCMWIPTATAPKSCPTTHGALTGQVVCQLYSATDTIRWYMDDSLFLTSPPQRIPSLKCRGLHLEPLADVPGLFWLDGSSHCFQDSTSVHVFAPNLPVQLHFSATQSGRSLNLTLRFFDPTLPPPLAVLFDLFFTP